MEDIFKDSEFSKFIDRVSDLDEDIGMLVHKLFKIPFVETMNCCSGHIGRHLSPDVDSATRQGYFVYRGGYLPFEITEVTKESEEFIQRTKDLVSQSLLFASIKKDKEKAKYTISLEMSDLVEPVRREENCDDASLEAFHVLDSRWNRQFNKVHARKYEVKQELAIKRYKEFKKFWKDMENIADVYTTKPSSVEK